MKRLASCTPNAQLQGHSLVELLDCFSRLLSFFSKCETRASSLIVNKCNDVSSKIPDVWALHIHSWKVFSWVCQHALIAKTWNTTNKSYEKPNLLQFLFQLRCIFRGKIFFCTFCILNVVSIITQLLIWSGFKEGCLTYMRLVQCRDVVYHWVLKFYTFLFIDCEKMTSQTYHRCPGWSWSNRIQHTLLNWSRHIRQEFWTDKKYAPVPFKHPRLSSAMATVMLPVLVALEGVVMDHSSRCRVHVILCHEVVPMEMPQTPRQRVKILRENRHATRGSHCSLLSWVPAYQILEICWEAQDVRKCEIEVFHESWMVFLKCGRYRVWCMGLGCWTMPVRCLAGEWDISDELAHTTVTGMHFKGDGWPRSKLQDHWFMSRRIGEDW